MCVSYSTGRTARYRTSLARDLESTAGFDAQGNVLYDLINPEMLDGLVVWTTSLSSYGGPEAARRVIARYAPLPIVVLKPFTAFHLIERVRAMLDENG